MAFLIANGRKQGFTLIELVVVMAILAVLLTLALPRYFDGLERAKEAALRQDLKTMREAIEQFHADKGVYPNTLEELVTHRYLRFIPADPMTQSAETWIIIPPRESEAGMVYDIRSGAEGQAVDGTDYANM